MKIMKHFSEGFLVTDFLKQLHHNCMSVVNIAKNVYLSSLSSNQIQVVHVYDSLYQVCKIYVCRVLCFQVLHAYSALQHVLFSTIPTFLKADFRLYWL